MPASLEVALKANAIAAAIQQITGETPDILYKDNTAELVFSENAAANIRNFIEAQLAKKSNISIAAGPVIMPLIIKKTLPLAIAAILALLIIGYFIGRY